MPLGLVLPPLIGVAACSKAAPKAAQSDSTRTAAAPPSGARPPTVNATEVQEARRRLGQSDEELADQLGVSAVTVQAWTAGRTVPRRYAQQIKWLAAAAEREAALRSSGLPECEWMLRHVAAPLPDDPDAALQHLEEANDHAGVCPVCVAREEFVAERFGPMPPMPQTG